MGLIPVDIINARKITAQGGRCIMCGKYRWLEAQSDCGGICAECILSLKKQQLISFAPAAPPKPVKIKPPKSPKPPKPPKSPTRTEVLSAASDKIIEIMGKTKKPLNLHELAARLDIHPNRVKLQWLRRICQKLTSRKILAQSDGRYKQYINATRRHLLSKHNSLKDVRESSINRVKKFLESATTAQSCTQIKCGLGRISLYKVLRILIARDLLEYHVSLIGKKVTLYALKSNQLAITDLEKIRENCIDNKIINIVQTGGSKITKTKIVKQLGLRSRGNSCVNKTLERLVQNGKLTREPLGEYKNGFIYLLKQP
jgi:hypothetical protein